MNWKVKALLQKLLSITKTGDYINHIPATLQKNYHYNVTFYQVYECIRKFDHYKVNFAQNQTALEIGTGYSLISSVVLSLIGFEKVITVDISKDIRFSTFKKQVVYLENPDVLKMIASQSIFPEQELQSKINQFKNAISLQALLKQAGIVYLAPYNFETIKKHTEEIHYICSQVVLEHIPPEHLEKLFKFTKDNLTKTGIAVHTINFIDHFTNPGFLQDSSISEFNFLKYADSYWNYWAGNAIAYTNRLCYLYYLELCKKYALNTIDFIGENYRERKEFDLSLVHDDILKKYTTAIDRSDLTKYQRGTLIISNK